MHNADRCTQCLECSLEIRRGAALGNNDRVVAVGAEPGRQPLEQRRQSAGQLHRPCTRVSVQLQWLSPQGVAAVSRAYLSSVLSLSLSLLSCDTPSHTASGQEARRKPARVAAVTSYDDRSLSAGNEDAKSAGAEVIRAVMLEGGLHLLHGPVEMRCRQIKQQPFVPDTHTHTNKHSSRLPAKRSLEREEREERDTMGGGQRRTESDALGHGHHDR